MKFARIDDNNTCAEFIGFEPEGKFHPSIKWVQVPEHLEAYADHSYVCTEDDEIAPPSLEYLRDQVKAKLADLRFRKETGGIELPDGTRIHTDRESQAQLSGAYSSLKNELIETTPWKAQNGWVQVTLAEITPVAQAVAAYVASCFAAEKSISDQIDALETAQAIAEFDIETAIDVELA